MSVEGKNHSTDHELNLQSARSRFRSRFLCWALSVEDRAVCNFLDTEGPAVGLMGHTLKAQLSALCSAKDDARAEATSVTAGPDSLEQAEPNSQNDQQQCARTGSYTKAIVLEISSTGPQVEKQ